MTVLGPEPLLRKGLDTHSGLTVAVAQLDWPRSASKAHHVSQYDICYLVMFGGRSHVRGGPGNLRLRFRLRLGT